MKRDLKMFLSSQSTHISVIQKHLLEGHEISECKQHVKDVTRHLLFVLPGNGRQTQCMMSLIPFFYVLLCHLVAHSKNNMSNRCSYRITVWVDWLLSKTIIPVTSWIKAAELMREANWKKKMASGEICDVTSYMRSSVKVFMLKPGILSVSCCSRCFSSRSTYTTATTVTMKCVNKKT